MNKYDYLKSDRDDVKASIRNIFGYVTEEEIQKAERRLGFKFPDELRAFYLEVGDGYFGHNHDFSATQEVYANRLLDPGSVADIKLLGYDSGQITPEAEFFPEDLPFFEIADGNDFFVLKPQSYTPNKVYDMFGTPIEDSFEKFIWRLYYESPTFYIKNS